MMGRGKEYGSLLWGECNRRCQLNRGFEPYGMGVYE